MSFNEGHHNLSKHGQIRKTKMDRIPSIEFRVFETIIPIESNLLRKSCLEFSYSFELDAPQHCTA
jgi:hypothetical protein